MTRAALAASEQLLSGVVARRGSVEVHASQSGVEADADLKLFETKWIDGEVGVRASTPWTRLDPTVQGLFKFRFW